MSSVVVSFHKGLNEGVTTSNDLPTSKKTQTRLKWIQFAPELHKRHKDKTVLRYVKFISTYNTDRTLRAH